MMIKHCPLQQVSLGHNLVTSSKEGIHPILPQTHFSNLLSPKWSKRTSKKALGIWERSPYIYQAVTEKRVGSREQRPSDKSWWIGDLAEPHREDYRTHPVQLNQGGNGDKVSIQSMKKTRCQLNGKDQSILSSSLWKEGPWGTSVLCTSLGVAPRPRPSETGIILDKVWYQDAKKTPFFLNQGQRCNRMTARNWWEVLQKGKSNNWTEYRENSCNA